MNTAQSWNQKGFSLVEVLLVVMMVGFIAMMIFNLPQSLRLTGASSHETLAKEIASQQIERLRSRTYENLGGNGTMPISDPRLDKLIGGVGSVTVADCPGSVCVNNEEIKQITVEVSWQDEGKTNSVKYDTLIARGGLR